MSSVPLSKNGLRLKFALQQPKYDGSCDEYVQQQGNGEVDCNEVALRGEWDTGQNTDDYVDIGSEKECDSGGS